MAVEKDLGKVTAYAYAKAAGYTGTEEQFQQVFNEFTENAPGLLDRLDDAVADAEAAQAAAETAVTNANTAKTAAETAQAAAEQAAQDMDDSVQQITTNKNDISDLKGSLTSEQTARQNADTALQDAIDVSILQAAVKTISANGTSSNTLTGLTADHVVGNWGMFSDSACTTPIPENSPTCDITITTAANAWSVTIANFSSTFYLRPTFILKQN